MSRVNRVIEIGGVQLLVPRYVNRTVSGWQARVRGLPSQHFADSCYGDAKSSLCAAADFAGAITYENKAAPVPGLDPEIEGVGIIDLSDELEPDQNGFKALSWWQEKSGLVHAFLTVGVIYVPLIDGYKSMVEQFSEAVPWLDLNHVATGQLKPMDVFALNSLDGCQWMDFAGVYLGARKPDRGLMSATAARVIFETSAIGLRRDAINFLWNLWQHEAYAYSAEFELEQRNIRSSHYFTRSADEIILTARSETLL